MKMLKKGLFAIALLGIFAVSAQALSTTYFVDPTNTGGNGWVKIDPNTDSGFNTGFSLGTWYKQWPGTVTVTTTYTALDLCCIPVYIEVGMFAEVYQCGNQKIILKQVPCTQIGKGAGDYPCYQGCTNLGVRGNFPMLLGLKKDNLDAGPAPVVDPNAANILDLTATGGSSVSKVYFAIPKPTTNPDMYPVGPVIINSGANVKIPAGLPGGKNSYYLTAVCLDAWKANLMYNLFTNPNLASGKTLMKIGRVCITVQPQ